MFGVDSYERFNEEVGNTSRVRYISVKGVTGARNDRYSVMLHSSFKCCIASEVYTAISSF